MIERKNINAKSRTLNTTYTQTSGLTSATPIYQAIDKGWAMVGTHCPTNQRVYAVRRDIAPWVEVQAPHLWKHYDPDDDSVLKLYTLPYYLLSEELLAWMELKWG